MEWSFFVGEDALKRLQPDMLPNEVGLLKAFDFNRALIQAAAMKAYKRESPIPVRWRPENEPFRNRVC